MIWLKILLIAIFLVIFLQDYKDRMVYWFLYPLAGVLAFGIQTKMNSFYIAFNNSLINMLFILILLFCCWTYAKFKNKELSQMIGLGDVLFFIFISCSFSTISFLVLFVFSLLFSLLLHAVLKNKKEEQTIPLAGYMSFFFGSIYFTSLFYNCHFLFAY